jgi:hypothetical protein
MAFKMPRGTTASDTADAPPAFSDVHGGRFPIVGSLKCTARRAPLLSSVLREIAHGNPPFWPEWDNVAVPGFHQFDFAPILTVSEEYTSLGEVES